MAFQTIYRAQATNQEGQLVLIHISDTDSGAGTPTYNDLELQECILQVENPGGDKHSFLASTKLQFTFSPNLSYSLATFLNGTDRKYLVEAFLLNTSIPIFKGYLQTDATQEAYLAVSNEWVLSGVELTAIDCLATLKEIPLTKDDGSVPRGFFKPIEYIAWILKKTGLELPINVVDSIVQEDADPLTEGNWMGHTLLWSKTFEGEETRDGFVCVDCYNALEIMLKGRRIYQYLGEWWIVRTDEFNGGIIPLWKYDADGVFDTFLSPTPVKQIGAAEVHQLAKRDGQVFPERANKYAKLNFRYELPRELVDNYSFTRQSETPFFTGTFVDPADGITKTEAFYTVSDWTMGRYGVMSENPVSSSAFTPYIRRVFYPAGYEVARHLVVPDTHTETTPAAYIRSNMVPVGAGDRLMVSVDFKHAVTFSPNHVNIMGLILKGDDANYYYWLPPTTGNPRGLWFDTSIYSASPNFYFAYSHIYQNNSEKTTWQTQSWDIKEVPVGGELYIYLSGGTYGELHYTNLNFEYLPYINGDYSKYSGQYHKKSQIDDYKAFIDEDAQVSDSPKKLFKGALFIDVAGVKTLTNAFYDYRYGSLGTIGVERFGRYLALDYINQHFRIITKFTGSLDGLDSLANPGNFPGLLHQYEFTETSQHTDDKSFMLLSVTINLLSCEWEGDFADVLYTITGKPFTWDHEFKYEAG